VGFLLIYAGPATTKNENRISGFLDDGMMGQTLAGVPLHPAIH
jgi:hypothetical protein